MSVRRCTFPWHWVTVTRDGDVLPCNHGAKSVGNLRNHSFESIWNGSAMRSVRAAILAGQVHPLCRCPGCPFQRDLNPFPVGTERIAVGQEDADLFDEEQYLRDYPAVEAAVQTRRYESGLEHYLKNGAAEGFVMKRRSVLSNLESLKRARSNYAIGLIEYGQRKCVVSAMPADLVVVVTTVCNLSCVMCPHGINNVDDPRHTASWVIERIIHLLPIASRIIISGVGEPLIAPAFWKIIKEVDTSQNKLIRVHSNGHYLNDQAIDRILDSGLSWLMISLDAAHAVTYRKIRGGDFTRVHNNIKNLIQKRSCGKAKHLKVSVTMTLMESNVDEAEMFVEEAHSLGVDTIIFSQLFPFGDQDNWVVKREGWTFSYRSELLKPGCERVALNLVKAMRTAERIGAKVDFHDNVAAFLKT